jgi:hypothetical protein
MNNVFLRFLLEFVMGTLEKAFAFAHPLTGYNPLSENDINWLLNIVAVD